MHVRLLGVYYICSDNLMHGTDLLTVLLTNFMRDKNLQIYIYI